jgi:hypothetical protein
VQPPGIQQETLALVVDGEAEVIGNRLVVAEVNGKSQSCRQVDACLLQILFQSP